MTLNNQIIKADALPFIENGRTMASVRIISEELGADVKWEASKRLVSITPNDKTLITLSIGNVNMTIVKEDKMETVVMDVPAMIKDNRTYVPLRYIAEALGLSVNWNAYMRMIMLTNV